MANIGKLYSRGRTPVIVASAFSWLSAVVIACDIVTSRRPEAQGTCRHSKRSGCEDSHGRRWAEWERPRGRRQL